MGTIVRQTLFSIILVLALSLPGSAFADTLLISPATGQYTQGQTFAVRIMVSSPAQAINAVSAILSYPTDKLQVVSVSKIGSILNLWVEEPAFNNAAGTVSLEGVVPNPGFTGRNGSVVTINFRAISSGTANLNFSSGSLLANDGYGTNVLRNRGTATFTVVPAPAPQAQSQEQTEIPSPTGSSVEEPEPYIDLNKLTDEEVPQTERQVSIDIPSINSVYDTLLKFFSVVIPVVALIFFLTHTFKRGVGNIRTLRRDLRRDLHNIDRLVDRAFDVLKDGVDDTIDTLENAGKKRKLTREETAVLRNLRQNLIEAEKVIHKEVSNAEKDLGE